jgi:hypothetical protein
MSRRSNDNRVIPSPTAGVLMQMQQVRHAAGVTHEWPIPAPPFVGHSGSHLLRKVFRRVAGLQADFTVVPKPAA